MHIVALGWMFVVVLMSAAEATAPQGSVLGALVTLLFYGLLPVAIVLYLLNTPHRRRALRRTQAAEHAAPHAATTAPQEADGNDAPPHAGRDASASARAPGISESTPPPHGGR